MSLQRLVVALPACLFALSLSGCGDTVCTAIFTPALNVLVVDADGMALTDAVVTYSYEGGPDQSCGTGSQLSCGGEGSGDYTLTAEAEGYESASLMVSVEEDGCETLTEDVTLELNPAP